MRKERIRWAVTLRRGEVGASTPARGRMKAAVRRKIKGPRVRARLRTRLLYSAMIYDNFFSVFCTQIAVHKGLTWFYLSAPCRVSFVFRFEEENYCSCSEASDCRRNYELRRIMVYIEKNRVKSWETSFKLHEKCAERRDVSTLLFHRISPRGFQSFPSYGRFAWRKSVTQIHTRTPAENRISRRFGLF